MPTVSANLKREIRRVPRIVQSSNEQPSQNSVTFVTFTHPETVLIPQNARRQIMPCTMWRGPSAVPGRSVVSANNLDQKKR